MKTIRLTMAQALVKYLSAQYIEYNGEEQPYFAGVWAIFGHGNVAGLGEALYPAQDELPTYRGHNEQSMAHAAIAFAKASRRQRAMACTSSIGPGATNMVTAAALAHVNRLPLLLLPGDVFANRRPDPVLQQIEDFGDGTISANDCFKPVSRYFDRITRPEQIINILPRMMGIFMDPANCGPVTLSLCQDVQAEAYDYPATLFEKRLWQMRRPPAESPAIDSLLAKINAAQSPLIVAGGGVYYSNASESLLKLIEQTGIPIAETQAAKSVIPASHPQNLGSIGVTGSSAANAAAQNADLVIAIGSRLQDFTTGSRSLFSKEGRQLVQINTADFDAYKHGAEAVIGDADTVIGQLLARLPQDYSVSESWQQTYTVNRDTWLAAVSAAKANKHNALPTDAEVIGAVQRATDDTAVAVCAAGGLPGELHKLWQAEKPGHYHVEYGFSCMGYEVAAGLGVAMAMPDSYPVVMVGDGSYLMMNSEIASAAALGLNFAIVILDNRGFGCINRLQMGTGGASFNNLLRDSKHEQMANIDFRAHAESLGANAVKVATIGELEVALAKQKQLTGVQVVVIDTDPLPTTQDGGHWWDVAVPEVSSRQEVQTALADYQQAIKTQRVDG